MHTVTKLEAGWYRIDYNGEQYELDRCTYGPHRGWYLYRITEHGKEWCETYHTMRDALYEFEQDAEKQAN